MITLSNSDAMVLEKILRYAAQTIKATDKTSDKPRIMNYMSKKLNKKLKYVSRNQANNK